MCVALELIYQPRLPLFPKWIDLEYKASGERIALWFGDPDELRQALWACERRIEVWRSDDDSETWRLW
jgi:hypothetical protein